MVCKSRCPSNLLTVKKAIPDDKALQLDGPVLVEILLPETEDVLPMVPPGGRLDQMLLEGMSS